MCNNYDIFLFFIFLKICRVWIKDICIIHSIRHQLGEGRERGKGEGGRGREGGKEKGEGGKEKGREGGREERRSKNNFSICIF